MREFEITIIHQGITYIGHCHEFQVIKVPQIYVTLRTLGKFGTAFTFYRVSAEELFWWDYNDLFKDSLCEIIANTILGNSPGDNEVKQHVPIKPRKRFLVLRDKKQVS